jgi:hypothetical protein
MKPKAPSSTPRRSRLTAGPMCLLAELIPILLNFRREKGNLLSTSMVHADSRQAERVFTKKNLATLG